MSSTHPRKAVAFTLNGVTVEAVPQLNKIAAIEAQHGAAGTIVRRLGEGALSITDMTGIVAIILTGCAGMPRKPDDLREAIFDAGPFEFGAAVVDWLMNAITGNKPDMPAPAAAQDAPGN